MYGGGMTTVRSGRMLRSMRLSKVTDEVHEECGSGVRNPIVHASIPVQVGICNPLGRKHASMNELQAPGCADRGGGWSEGVSGGRDGVSGGDGADLHRAPDPIAGARFVEDAQGPGVGAAADRTRRRRRRRPGRRWTSSRRVPGSRRSFGVGGPQHASIHDERDREPEQQPVPNDRAAEKLTLSMRLSREFGWTSQPCVNSGICRPSGHASLGSRWRSRRSTVRACPGSLAGVGVGWRSLRPQPPFASRFRASSARPGACVYFGVGASFSTPTLNFHASTVRACVYFGVGWLNHASIPGSVRPSMRLFQSRLTRACVYFGSRLTRACVYFGVGWLKHASIPGSVDPSMRLFRGRLAQACVNSGT